MEVDIKTEVLNTDELEHFCDAFLNKSDIRNTFTIDYFDTSFGILNNKFEPSSIEFCISLLNEILCKMKPSDEMWDKIKFAAFILNLTTRQVDFNILYNVYHQVELEIVTKHLDWKDEEVKTLFECEILDRVVFTSDLHKKSDHETQSQHNHKEENQDVTLNGFYNEAEDLPDNTSLEPEIDEKDHKIKTDLDHFEDNFVNGIEDIEENLQHDKIDEEKYKIQTENGFTRESRRSSNSTKIKYEELDSDQDVEDIPPKNPPTKRKPKEKKTKLDTEEKPPPKKRKKKEESHPWACTLCKFKGQRQKEFDLHGFEVHKTTRLCSECGHLSSTYQDFKDHEKTHLVQCELCQEKCMSKRALKFHMKTIHNKIEEDKVSCDVCGKLMKAVSLKFHMSQVHSGKIYKCDLCDFVTSGATFLRAHRKRHLQKPVKCPECGKLVKRLGAHLKRNGCNAQERVKHKCDLCDMTFTLKDGVKRHMKRVHLKVYSHFCEYCDFKTCSTNNLRTHVTMVHLKEERWKICPLCSKKTSNLDHHCKINHPEEYFSKAIPELIT